MNIHIIGAGGFARETAALIEDLDLTIGMVSGRGASVARTYPEGETPPAGSIAAVAIGNPAVRRRAAAEADDLCVFPPLVHPSVITHSSVDICDGAIICAGTILTCDIRVGEFVIINMGCTIGHDCVLGDYTTLGPGVHLSGNITVGEGVLFGSGAVVRQGVHIGAGATVGAGAVVLEDVPAGLTVVGVPAR